MRKVLPFIIAGGALYYYDQNVDPIISRNFQKSVPEKVTPQRVNTPIFQKSDVQAAKEDTKSVASQISKDVEDKYNQLESKTSELANKWSSKLGDKKDEVSKELDSQVNKAQNTWSNTKILPEEKSSVRSGVAGYLDYINHLGNVISGKAKETETEISRQKPSYQNSWFSWGTGHKESLEQAYDVNKARAIKKYELAKQQLDDTVKEWSKSERKTPDVEYRLTDAQKNFDSSMKNLKSYGQEVIDQVNKDFEASKNSWFKWGLKQQDKLEAEYEKNKSKASQHYEEARKKFDDLTKQIQVSNPFKSQKEANDHLEAARNDLSKSYEDLKLYGSSFIESITK